MVQELIDTIITTAKLLNYKVNIYEDGDLFITKEKSPIYKTSIIIQIWSKNLINIIYDIDNSNNITSLYTTSKLKTTNQEEMILQLNKTLLEL